MKKSNGIIETVILVAIFLVLWKTGVLDASFEILLMSATIICGIFFVAEYLYFKKNRLKKAQEYFDKENKENEILKENGIDRTKIIEETFKEMKEQPSWLDWTAGLFPIIFIIFIARSFLYEPFTIPSGSMMPTLIKGDNILVNKYHYGLRLPVFDNKLTEGNKVERGDIIVFHYPLEHNVNYIKRAVGLPGDVIEYKNKELFINGEQIKREQMDNYQYPVEPVINLQFKENLGGVEHRILIDPNVSGTVKEVLTPKVLDYCEYAEEHIKCVVPENHYFMLGDNRDGSSDSRYWGMVPDKNLVGKAVYLWSNFGDMSRVGSIK